MQPQRSDTATSKFSEKVLSRLPDNLRELAWHITTNAISRNFSSDLKRKGKVAFTGSLKREVVLKEVSAAYSTFLNSKKRILKSDNDYFIELKTNNSRW